MTIYLRYNCYPKETRHDDQTVHVLGLLSLTNFIHPVNVVYVAVYKYNVVIWWPCSLHKYSSHCRSKDVHIMVIITDSKSGDLYLKEYHIKYLVSFVFVFDAVETY